MAVEVNVNCKDMRKHQNEVAYALQELKKKMKKEGTMHELKRREHYVPPSRKRKLKSAESVRQRKRDERKAEWQRKKSDF